MDHTAAAAGGSAGWRGADAAAPGGTLGAASRTSAPQSRTSVTSVAPVQLAAPPARPGRERGVALAGRAEARGSREAEAAGENRWEVGPVGQKRCGTQHGLCRPVLGNAACRGPGVARQASRGGTRRWETPAVSLPSAAEGDGGASPQLDTVNLENTLKCGSALALLNSRLFLASVSLILP
ncbi:uncharacterized protein LOC129736334 [Falco cherrug]|uniref:uncharacterized protein LOC129736334 n=1 Tax=Falco cherrug TaxID=345164 RepID=UPI00247994F9|nr:uncharacterized protein LOC129736334 [Falco cherrug]